MAIIVAILGAAAYAYFRKVDGYNWAAELGKFAWLAGLIGWLV